MCFIHPTGTFGRQLLRSRVPSSKMGENKILTRAGYPAIQSFGIIFLPYLGVV